MAKTRFGSLDGIHEIRKKTVGSTTLISVGLFTIVFILFLLAVSKTTSGTVNEQSDNLREAVDRAIVQCYVTEGRYPESFEYLKKNYGIIYDDELFRVDYVIYGSNMKPDVTIIRLK
ncbi:hypothetical protein [Pseudobutyrivibrio xylanivorans]|uniref:Type II secretion system protein n=1 Tax=Pseudobutyrivibrio xylanivorans TaxID=185007 RepID=A0A5P6VQS5_PSEXY|nr:hypothetical protein [Pseudobutyrivibrio xylanivorans]QFJ55033.1 hypothetical protein FXF36_09235 [Pseudobutyrivibrio xylanivorans]